MNFKSIFEFILTMFYLKFNFNKLNYDIQEQNYINYL
jgi:hypothetical protein